MDNDQNSAGIAMSKFQADGTRYFGLFDPHIPSGLIGNILLLSLGNLDCVAKAVGKNPGASYTVVDDAWMLDCLRALPPSGKMEFIEDLDVYNIIKGLDMKFDCIIMNPPYQKNLHLKVLAEAIKHLKDDNSVCVNLSPVRWLQDPLMLQKSKSDYHRFEKSILNHTKQIDVIDKIDAQRLFESTVMGADLGIYCCGNNGGFDSTSLVNPIVKKIVVKQNSHINLEYDKRDGIRVRFPIINNNGGSGNGRKIGLATFGKLLYFVDGKKDGKPWYDWYMKNQYSKITDDIPFSARFDTEKEAQNFIDTLVKTNFGRIYTHWMKRDVNVSPEIVLWMGDAVNPRTSLKGYQGEWTDEDFYRYFMLTDDEIKTIEDTMKKYAAK